MNLVDSDSLVLPLGSVYVTLCLLLPKEKPLEAQEPLVRDTIEITRKFLAQRDLDSAKLCVTLLWRPLQAKGHLNPWLVSIHRTLELLLLQSRVVRRANLDEVYNLAHRIDSHKEEEGVPFDTLSEAP